MVKKNAAWSKLVFGHLLHLAILLLPTLLLSNGVPKCLARWPIVVFAFVVFLAAVLESSLASEGDESALVQDVQAVRVARMVGILLLVVFWLAQLESIYVVRNESLIQWVGVMMSVVGIALRVAAIWTLGSKFVTDVSVTEIIRTGVYRWLRHPSEIGLLLFATGCPLILISVWTAVFAAVCLIPISAWRMQRETAALKQFESR